MNKYDIAKFWAYFNGDANRPKIFVDLGEPDCMACGIYNDRYSDFDEYIRTCHPNLTEKFISANNESLTESMWQLAGLHALPIIPYKIGGDENDAGNHILVCGLCLLEYPITANPQEFLEWRNNRMARLCERHFKLQALMMGL